MESEHDTFHIPKKTRKNAISRLVDDYDTEEFKQICGAIEKGIYHYTKQYCESNLSYMSMAESIYNDKLNDICFNLRNNGKTIRKLKRKITKNRFDPYNLAYLRPNEIAEENWNKILSRINKTEETANNLPTIKWKPCKTCKNVDHFYYQLQTRSGDEPMTTFYICKNCERETAINN